MRSKLLVAHKKLGAVDTADSVRCAHVRLEIIFFLTFETAQFFCVYPVETVYIYTIHLFIPNAIKM
jgi:hypothetical protein